MRSVVRQRGQAMFEFNVALPFLMPVVLVVMMLVVQWTFIYVAKSTLNSATVKAVRAGTLNYGSTTAMNKALAQGMMSLFATGTEATDTLAAYGKARAAVTALAQLRVLNPNRAVFDQFKYRARENNRSLYEIPNNNLMYRSSAYKNVGGGRQLNIQDANLLQIEVRWCQRLVVPFANRVINQVVTSPLFGVSDEQLACNALGLATGDVYMAMVSQGMMRMQTPFRM
ncbi:pilus assembly protein [Shewanella cyperi]|uniref:pilus assembly protein n=1 Tax=Shewanella cyperi TaxID=2814292 RepID=UPI001A953A9A|nr:pilus assembly protein [Shewanella cyperi]QSX40156.1 pilus assembly protein [Shewanella cyperi]